MRFVFLILTLVISYVASAAGTKFTKEEYVSKWSAMAIEQMILHKIPASITLAQGLLESASGNSELAINANNHFGIKCHNWTGNKYFYDDDKKQECFRNYQSAEQSYLDRSAFLKSRERYAHLFSFQVTDYKAWAKGLKAAGYATNPKYAELLIDMIEKLKLYEYDKLGVEQFSLPDLKKPDLKDMEVKKEFQNISMTNAAAKEVKEVKVVTKHEVLQKSNKVKYVVAKRGDTFYRISLEFGISLGQMYRFNDFESKKDILVPGDIIYLMPKKSRGKETIKTYKSDKSVVEISQEEGIKLKSLMKRNGFESQEWTVKKGQSVRLR